MKNQKQKRRVNIYLIGEIINSVVFDDFTSQITEQAFFFMEDEVVVAIVPFNHLIIFSNEI